MAIAGGNEVVVCEYVCDKYPAMGYGGLPYVVFLSVVSEFIKPVGRNASKYATMFACVGVENDGM